MKAGLIGRLFLDKVGQNAYRGTKARKILPPLVRTMTKTCGSMIDLIVRHYVTSRDFNGMSIPALMEATGYEVGEICEELERLLKVGQITLAFGCMGNPFIKAFDPPPVKVQAALLFKDNREQICAYPTEPEVRKRVELNQYDDRPFSKKLALTEPQLKAFYFDMAVLERYYNDPRYLFCFDDYRGMISISDSYDESESVAERDKVFMQDFGLGYDADGNRVVVVYLRRLNGLSPEHQQYWQTFSLSGQYQMCDDYYKNTIQGEFAEGISIYRAILEDQLAINDSCIQMGRTPLFRNTFVNCRPSEFGVILRPTLKNYEDFIHVLDKMLSENIDKKFFKDDVPLEEITKRADGTVEVRQRGTLAILDEWLRKTFPSQDPDKVSEIVGPLKEVRELRQSPAHKISDNEYDRGYYQLQDQLMEKLYRSVNYLRQQLTQIPTAHGYEGPEHLGHRKIKSY